MTLTPEDRALLTRLVLAVEAIADQLNKWDSKNPTEHYLCTRRFEIE